tara:strand:+ start:5850 stop:8096 length:2247 start_codon:yes stop_codon:yes gene_type:complete
MSKERIETIKLKDYAEDSYLNYSMYVILDRALPNIGDGMKPVQRRILYAMSELGLNAGAKFKKSARTVGDVIGKFHPHGDSAAYEAMVLMAQSFSFRYPLVDGQGNWGTQDDPKSFAAMRYTESRLTAFANLLLDELKLGTVAWQPNFDGSLLEPTILPSKVPNILLNGTTGIAVGMATDIPSHNISEVIDACCHILENPKSTTKELMKHVKGPDFTNKSKIIASKEELFEIYDTGRGAFKMQANWTKEGNDIIVNALPHQASGSKILEQIADQMAKKKIPMIVDLRDEGDHKEPIRLVISLKSNRVDAEEVMSHLFATTDLQKNYRANINLIDRSGSPRVFSLKELVSEWLKFRLDTTLKKLKHRLDLVNDRIHILEGLLIVYIELDTVIKIIRQSENPKKDLIKAFKISEPQANAILEIKLRQLARLEQIKLETERKDLLDEKQDLDKIVSSKARLKTYVKRELKQIKDEFGDDRYSEIIEYSESKAFSQEEILSAEPVTVVLSQAGWIRSAKGHDINPETLAFRGEDALKHFANGRNNQMANFFDSTGKVFSIAAHTLPSARGMGEPITGRISAESGVSFQGVIIGTDDQSFVISNTSGYGFISEIRNIVSTKKTGKNFIKIPHEAGLIPPILIKDHHTHLASISSLGRMLVFEINELPNLAKGKGNKIMNIPKPKFLAGEESMSHICLVGKISSMQIHSGKRHMNLKLKDCENYISSRAKRGLMLPQGYRKVDKVIEIIDLDDS